MQFYCDADDRISRVSAPDGTTLTLSTTRRATCRRCATCPRLGYRYAYENGLLTSAGSHWPTRHRNRIPG